MSVRVSGRDGACLYDSTTGIAFGPVFENGNKASLFLQHLHDIGERDPRVIPVGELIELANEWEAERDAG